MMIPVPSSGILEQVEGVEAAQQVLHVTSVQITARLHDSILAWPEGSSYLGLFLRKRKARQLLSALREAHAELHFQINQTLPVEHPITGKSSQPRFLTRVRLL
jgi:hypothetical protein